MHPHSTQDEWGENQQIQNLQNAFSDTFRAAAIILDKEGNAVTEPSMPGVHTGWSRQWMEAFWETEPILALIEKSRQALLPEWSLQEGAIVAVTPILVEDECLGAWVVAWLAADGAQLEQQEQEVARVIGFLSTLSGSIIQLEQKNKQLRRTLKRLDGRSKWLRAFVDANETPMYVTDFETGEIQMVNQAFCRQMGLEEDMLLGEKCWKVNGNSQDGFCSSCPRNSLVDKQNTPSGVHVWETYNEKLGRWLKCTNKALYLEGGRLAHMVTQVDITQSRKLRENLLRSAYYDRHTGLPNSEKLTIDLREIKNDIGIDVIYLVCLQLEGMHQFNQVYGKKNGYRLFASVAKWLESLDDSFTVYRAENYGFIILLSNYGLRGCKNLAKTIQSRFNEPWSIDIDRQPVFHYCAVYGAILCLNNDYLYHDIHDLMERTLESAAEKKDFLIYDESVDMQEKYKVQFEITLKNQIRNGMNGFGVHYQPIVDVQTGIWKGLEALCRWTHPDTGDPVPPSKFIPEAERLGLIGQVGEWVLEQGVALCKTLKLDRIDGFFLSVNMSFLQILDEGFVERVESLLNTYNFPAGKLDLEVTESMEFHFNEYTLSVIEHLQELGIHLALDDFGTGYSSFTQLKNLPAKFLKTEREFVLDIEQDIHMQYFYYFISEFAHMNNMKLIAEGVENPEQLQLVKNNGADFVQGYYFSKPIPTEQLGESLMHFHQPVPGYNMYHSSRPVNLQQWLNGSIAYAVTPKLFQLLNQSIETLFAEQNIEPLFGKVLELIGSHFGVSRAFAYVYGGDNAVSSVFEWCDKKTKPYKYHLSAEAIQKANYYLQEAFSENSMLISSDIEDLSPALYELLYPEGIRAVLVLPMYREGKTLGFLGFEDTQNREWAVNEVVMLWNLALVFKARLEQVGLERDFIRTQHMLADILSIGKIHVMVCDIDTSEILWISEAFPSPYLTSDAVGRKCYEVIQGDDSCCRTCKVHDLLHANAQGPLCYKSYSKQWDRYFLVYDNLIQWKDNQLAYIKYILDITEEEEQLHYINKEALTGYFEPGRAE